MLGIFAKLLEIERKYYSTPDLAVSQWICLKALLASYKLICGKPWSVNMINKYSTKRDHIPQFNVGIGDGLITEALAG